MPDTGAYSASNLKLKSGELHPLSNPGLLYTSASPKNATQISIFNARNGATDDDWFTWPIDVDCVRVPLATDVESRFCWTGDGAPKTIKYTNAISGGGFNYPLLANELTLGIPTPTVACGVSHAGGVGSAATRYYCYTYLSQDGEESAPSPLSTVVTGKTDGTWSITGMGIAPLNTGVVSGTTRSSDTITATTSLAHWLRVGDSVVVAGVGTMTEANGTWTVATVPSSVTFTYTVTAAATGAPGTAGTWTRSTPWNISGMTKNLYRTSGSLGSFQLVNNATIPAATTTYSDTYTDAVIAGDELISNGWVPPPVGLRGLCVHPSGALMGFVSNLLCMSEPYQPHAWPEAYQLASGYNAVGLALFGTSAVMATAGMPYVATGVEPASMTGEDVQGMYPCLSKRSVISIGGAVLYASLHGLIMVGSSGVGVFTDPWYTRDEWEDLNPSTMICATANGRVYVVYTTDAGVQTMLVIDGDMLTTADVSALEVYGDPTTGELYITKATGIYLWDDPDEVPLQGSWRSKDFIFPTPINIGAGKVEFEMAIDPAILEAINAAIAAIAVSNALLLPTPGDPLTATTSDALAGAWADDDYAGTELSGCNLSNPPDTPASNAVTITLYSREGSGDTLISARTVTDTLMFRLPAGYKRDAFSVQITSQCVVKEVRLAETADGLRQG